MRNLTRAVALAATAGLMLTACASGADDSSSTNSPAPAADVKFEAKDPLTIGYSVYDLQNPYWQSYTAGVKAGAEAAGVGVVVVDQKSDQGQQVSGSLDLINQGISGLIVTPVQPSALPSTIDAAHDAKIPVVIADIGVAGDYDAYIQSNNANGGALAAEYVIEQLGEAPGPHKVGVIELHAGSVVGEERVSEFVSILGDHENFEIVSSLDGNDTVDGGFAAAQDMLSANPDLEVIYAANDDSAIGAQRAMETAGKSVADGFILIGFDGADGALDLIEQGLMSATVAQDPYGQGIKAVETILALLEGDDAGYDDAATRTVFFPVEIVTSANLAEFRTALAAKK
ncbi:substrate-binding domain-containing protein [Cellulomonas chengniuliangii]|uniref:Substrate-binding domain-containing protein n=1 Tax=Cellulomonas chengniuliangii TaxID=2968084 RepID=A0ABY5L2H0_9CELL|nr:substrate-binding domain-containing protein [Cellulomonas chengniuliangii]MCC2307548.1 substrate-binding domain-containing protein [Cellulomonas chengniuliangii]MCC2318660.1 substrate-binding domain-containing protein [Cellulomonas chengniuliangii]UUI75681.1 substrate-binding domain-containing protein [Cellulomonas chengniuliangii]